MSYKGISFDGAQGNPNRRSVLNQLVDVIQEDVSGSATRKKYQVFVTGGIGPGVTSSLFQTVYDQDFTLQTANPILDVTCGLFAGSETFTGSNAGLAPSLDAGGKYLFASNSLMMREKNDIYRQYAARLLGNSAGSFICPFGSVATNGSAAGAGTILGEAIFLSFKRLFSRDSIKKETFAMRWYNALNVGGTGTTITRENINAGNGSAGNSAPVFGTSGEGNLYKTSNMAAKIITDFGQADNAGSVTSTGDRVGNLYFADDTSFANAVGLIFYDAGTVVLDAKKATVARQRVNGVISAMRAGTITVTSKSAGSTPKNIVVADGKTWMGSNGLTSGALGITMYNDKSVNLNARFIPDFFYSASIDNIIDHVTTARMSSGSLTACTFQNNTEINSKIYFCRATADEFNYSSNPTFTNAQHEIVVIPQSDDSGLERSFTFITTVGLYDGQNNLLAVAKLSRPVEKNDEKDLTIRVRLDF